MDRHCAFCLVGIPAEKVLLCGVCKRRAYCQKSCQKADWSLKGGGQGHKDWCKLGCCEEDLDWSVEPIQGKGLGLIAKKVIPAKTRIIVEANCSSPTHPGVKDLLPTEGTFEEKFILNSLGCAAVDKADLLLCLRIARSNHSCDPNACHSYDSTFKVKVLFSERNIQIGEEICIAYKSFKDITQIEIGKAHRDRLQTIWGIICPLDCDCRDQEIQKIASESKKLDSEIFALVSSGKLKTAFEKIQGLMKKEERIRSGFINLIRTLWDGFQIGIMKKETLGIALEWIQQASLIESSICHPESESSQKYRKWVTEYPSHRNYLFQERRSKRFNKKNVRGFHTATNL